MTQSNSLRKALSKQSEPVVRRNVHGGASVSWSAIPDDAIADLIRCACGYGSAVIIGVTSDGGALSITVLDGEKKIKEYPHDEEAFIDFFRWLRDEYYGHGPTLIK